MSVPKAYIQYNCIPHYRSRIFELLSNAQDVEYTILADIKPDTVHLKTVSGEDRAIRHVVEKNHILRLPKLPSLFFQPGALLRVYRDRPDVVIALGSPYSVTAWMMVMLGRLLDIPVLLWTHGLLGNEKGIKWYVRKVLYRLASGTLLYGEYARNLLIEKGFEADRQFVVYNSLDYDIQQDVMSRINLSAVENFRSCHEIGEDERLIVFTGRLQPIKKLDMLIDAVSKCNYRGNDVHLAFIGDGDERYNLEAQAKAAGIENKVHFLGESYDESYICTALTAADLSVVPSGAGLSVMHSMVYGTPVIIHDDLSMHFPEWEAVIEGMTGYFYKYDDVDDLSRVIDKALFPDSCRSAMKENCMAVIREKYNPHAQVKAFGDAVKATVARL